jgi:hypothetical protein
MDEAGLGKASEEREDAIVFDVANRKIATGTAEVVLDRYRSQIKRGKR